MYTIQFNLSKPASTQTSSSNGHIQAARPQQVAIMSPCIGVCEMRTDGFCAGCMRTLDEIARWSMLSDAERETLMQDVLPSRA
jgi:uncharacterized protein